ncbi:hypothetical protein ACVLV4_001919 [Rathayibacter agropyri]
MTAAHLATFVSHRIAAVPASVLDLRQVLSASHLDRVLALHVHAGSLRAEVAQRIHDVVPTSSAKPRRALLTLRRDLYNDREPRADGRTAAANNGIELHHAVTASAAAKLALKLLDRMAEEDSARAENCLRLLLGNEDIDDALRLVAPGFHKSIYKPAPAGSKRSRSAMAFASRAALKPSPLSTLARTAVTGSDLTGRTSGLSPMIVMLFFEALVRRQGALPAIRFRSTFSQDGGRIVASPETSAMINSTVSFTRRALQLSDDDGEARSLSQWTGGDEVDLLALAGDGGWPRVERWISAMAVQACIPWEADTKRPENVLGKLMMSSPAGEIAQAGGDLLAVGRQAEEVASLSGEARTETVDAVSRRLERIAEVVGAILPQGRLIDEDAGCTPPNFVPLSVEEITVLDATIRPKLFRSRVYDLLLDTFLTEYGSGGATIDVMGFFTSCSLSTRFRHALRAARAADRGPDAHMGRGTLPVGVTSAPPSASIFLQRTAEDQNGNLVVNQVMPGLGAVIARFTALGDGPETLSPAIATWVTDTYPDVTDCRALIPGARVSALQRAATAVLPTLDGDDLGQALAQLILRHDVEHNVLEFTRPDGQPIAPVPLGIVPAWTFEGPIALLMTLLNPWIDGTLMTRESDPVFRARRSHDLVREPRVTTGTVVTRRETWRVPADSVPTRSDESIGQFLMRLHSWRSELGLPEEVFVRVHGDDPFDSATRKPLWLRFTSWHAVSAVWALIPGRHSLEIQECVPTRAPNSPTVESVITMRWARPGRSGLGCDGQSSKREKVAP